MPTEALMLEWGEHDGPVFDIQVEGDHSFVLACGLIAHNCDLCVALEEDSPPEGIPLDDEFPGGYDAPPAHPNCRCTLTYVLTKAYQDQADDQAEPDPEDS